jgi:flagellar hook-associated protein FlgK
MNSFSIGISALTVGRRGMDLTGQNIANATTPGYRRQTLGLASRVTAGYGTGVEVSAINRFTAWPIRTAILTGNSQQSAASTRLDARRQIETAFGQGENTIGGKLQDFFNKVERLTSKPGESAVRRELVSAASDLARQFNGVSGDIDRLKADVGRQATQTVDEVNSITSRIADLNGRIYAVEVRGEQANELKDQRDQLIDDLSQRMDLRTVDVGNGVVNVMGRDTTMVVGEVATKLAIGANASNQLEVTVAGTTTPLRFDGGSLGGLMKEYNQDIPATRGRLDAMAAEFVKRVDKVQATGLGLDGPIASTVGTRPVADPTQPLATQNLPIGMTNGTLRISVTNTGTQTRVGTDIAIDPSTMSLNDVAAAITAGTGGQVQATVDTPQNVLRLQAQPGFAFDFAGRPDSPPAAVFATPTTADTDTGGALAALGVNGLFAGSSANDIQVRPEFTADPNLVAASGSGRSGDASNLIRLAAVRDQPAINGRTISAEYTDLAAQVGVQVRSLGDEQTAQAGVLQTLNAQEQAVVGVDVNEELVHLLNYQRMVEGASRFISSVNEALDSIIQMTR